MAKKKSSGRRTASSSKAKREAVKYAKNHKKGIAIFVASVVLILALAILILYLVKPAFLSDLFRKAQDAYLEYTKIYYGDSADDDAEGVNGAATEAVPAGNLEDISNSEFSIHFLELGNKYTGDCTLIKCGETEVLIDAGSRKSSATTIKSYVDQYIDGKLDYVIATHAHQDHIAGFVGNTSGSTKTGILYQYDIGTLIQFSRHNSTADIYNSYVDAVNYAQSNGTAVYTATQCWNGTNGAHKQYELNADGSLTLNILYNYYYEHDTDDENDYSVCVLLSYTPEGGEASHYLFTGDLEGKGEEYLVEYNDLPKVKLFKGGHHGSKTSSTDKLLKIIQPENIAVCCCAGSTEYTTNNDNTFPTQAFIDRVSAYTENVYVTTLCIDYKAGTVESMNGNIVFYFGKGDGEDKNSLKLWCSNNMTKLKDTEWFSANRTAPAAWAS